MTSPSKSRRHHHTHVPSERVLSSPKSQCYLCCTDDICDGRCGQHICCPYGYTYVVPATLGIIALILAFLAPFGCHFFSARKTSSPTSEQHFGLWQVDTDPDLSSGGTCKDWSHMSAFHREDVDWPLTLAQVISLTTCLSSFCYMAVFLTASCRRLPTRFLRVTIVVFIVFGLLMESTMIALASKHCKNAHDCRLIAEGILAILSGVFWLFAGLSILLMRDLTVARTVKPTMHGSKSNIMKAECEEPDIPITGGDDDHSSGDSSTDDRHKRRK